MATISDVAKKAKVSVATVSRVLNSSEIVSKEKRELVQKAIHELQYTPTTYSHKQKELGNKAILVICSTVIDPIITGIQDAAEAAGYSVILSYVGSRQKNVASSSILQNDLIDGVIFANLFFFNDELMEISKQFPTVQCGEYFPIPNTFFVATQDENSAFQMVSYLLNSGRKRIGLISLADLDNASHHFADARENGYFRALKAFNISYDQELIQRGDLSNEFGAEAALRFLQLKEPPDAIFSIQDTPAIGCLKALQTSGIKVPEDICVAGFDNTDLSEICTPSLTTVAQPYYEMGKESVRTLLSVINNEISLGRHILLDAELIIRDSTIKMHTAGQ